MSYLVLCLTSFAVCGAGALLPFLNTEVYLVGAAALTPRPLWVPLVLSGTVGAMAGKVLLYYAGKGVVRIPNRKVRSGMEAMQAKMAARPLWAKWIYAVSALVGLPPYYLTTVAAGAIEMNFAFFLVIGFIGRLVRFGIVVMLPELARRAIG